MAVDYLRMTADAIAVLPPNKQEEVYNFARFLETSERKSDAGKKPRKGSVLNIIGLGRSGIRDIALNHDKYLYDE